MTNFMSEERRGKRLNKTKRGKNLAFTVPSTNPSSSTTKTAAKRRLINSQLIGNCPNRGKYRHRTGQSFNRDRKPETIFLINAISSFQMNHLPRQSALRFLVTRTSWGMWPIYTGCPKKCLLALALRRWHTFFKHDARGRHWSWSLISTLFIH